MSRAGVFGQLQPIQLWDGTGCWGYFIDGQPAFPFRLAPPGLATRRQLRAEGLCPGGHPHFGLLVWRARPGRRGWAYLYRRDLAQPKRVPSPGQVVALDRAMEARRLRETCPTCREHVGYRIPQSLGACYSCADWPHQEAAA